jgi:uncharacterized protein YdcH (DUF465 family)
MNTTKSVYNKLFKEEATELASHKIELGITEFDDLLSRVKAKDVSFQSTLKVFEEALQKVKIAKSDLTGYSMDLSEIKDRAKAQVDKDSKAARDLGLDPAPFIKKYNEINTLADKLIDKISNQTKLVK